MHTYKIGEVGILNRDLRLPKASKGQEVVVLRDYGASKKNDEHFYEFGFHSETDNKQASWISESSWVDPKEPT